MLRETRAIVVPRTRSNYRTSIYMCDRRRLFFRKLINHRRKSWRVCRSLATSLWPTSFRLKRLVLCSISSLRLHKRRVRLTRVIIRIGRGYVPNLTVIPSSEKCPIAFDMYLCWPESDLNTTVHLPCPASIADIQYYTKRKPKPKPKSFPIIVWRFAGNVTRHCHYNQTWSAKADYSGCVPMDDLSVRFVVRSSVLYLTDETL